MKTYLPSRDDLENKKWYLVDANERTLGRLAVRIATVLRGKHKPIYTPNTDTGDFVVVVNAEKIAVTGNKLEGKIYYSHSGYIGGIKDISLGKLLEKAPEQVITKAVKGMLPKGPLGRAMLKKLKVYAGENHPHKAQDPIAADW